MGFILIFYTVLIFTGTAPINLTSIVVWALMAFFMQASHYETSGTRLSRYLASWSHRTREAIYREEI